MGTNKGYHYEKPVHRVTLSAFYGEERVFRGGSWLDPGSVRVASLRAQVVPGGIDRVDLSSDVEPQVVGR